MSSNRARLVEIIRARSFSTGSSIKLVSGQTSSFYFNMKPTMLHPEGSYLTSQLLLDAIAADNADYIGGLEMGAVPIATSASTMSHHRGKPLPAIFVRKATKDHGTQKLVEGLAPGESLKGKRVIVVEDVTTTGGSSMKAVEALRAEGAEIVASSPSSTATRAPPRTSPRPSSPSPPTLTIDDFK